jgi:hypothetical protein
MEWTIEIYHLTKSALRKTKAPGVVKSKRSCKVSRSSLPYAIQRGAESP